MSKRVAVYARVSTTRQAENDISIPDQLAHARRYCSERGWHIAREFVDAGASARDDKRQEFQSLMDAACVDPSPFDIVLFHSQSRFFRDVAGYTFWKRKLSKHGVSLLSMTQGFGEGPSADFAETILAAADQYTSAETAKHVTRTMLENARQGFWNGSQPPFGYRTVEAEKRGQRTKKKLEIEEREAGTVRQIFELFLRGDGTKGPMGIKDIASWLNAHGFRNRGGNPFYTSAVHAILTREAYSGIHHYNTHDSRSRAVRDKSEWIAVPVPEIVARQTFETVQARLKSRRPNVTAPRIVNSEVLLTGIARCESCGAPLMLSTGKSGRYRYYACSAKRLKGRSACKAPIIVPEAQLDQLVIGALADQLLTPQRLVTLVREASRHRRDAASTDATRRAGLRKDLKHTETQIDRLLTAVAEGHVPDSSLLRDKLVGLNHRRDESLALLASLDRDLPAIRQAISNRQAATVAANLKRRLLDAPRPLQRRYVRGLVSEIVVDRERAVISGPRAAIASAASNPETLTVVPSFAREWRARKDSNL